MHKKVIATGFFLLSLMLPIKVSAQNYDQIYVFGDSLSDTGNVFNTTGGVIPPSDNYFNGRFSNGPIWVEYLANDLRLTFNPTNNFAFGGATTGFENIGLASLPGLQQEISSFTVANQPADPNALYIVWAGTNDYIDYLFGGTPNPTQTVANLSTAVTSLVNDGAKNILVANLPDLGKFPVTDGNSQTSSVLSTLTSAHDSDLTLTLSSLRQNLNSDINIIPLDLNSLFNQIINTPGEFGLTDVTDFCIHDLSIVPFNLTTQPVACDPSKFLFWDPIHLTTATNKLIGDFAFSTLLQVPVPEPSTVLGILAFGALGLVSRRKRQEQSELVK